MTFMDETPGEAGVAMGVKSQGLPSETIQALPKIKMEKGNMNCPFGEQCAICLADFDGGDTARRLPGCGHWFHQECIDLWLVRNACCPHEMISMQWREETL